MTISGNRRQGKIYTVQMWVGWQMEGWELRVNSDCFYFCSEIQSKTMGWGLENINLYRGKKKKKFVQRGKDETAAL